MNQLPPIKLMTILILFVYFLGLTIVQQFITINAISFSFTMLCVALVVYIGYDVFEVEA